LINLGKYLGLRSACNSKEVQSGVIRVKRMSKLG